MGRGVGFEGCLVAKEGRLPEDMVAEATLLATISAPGREMDAATIIDFLNEDDFVHPGHQAVFRAVRSCRTKRLENHPQWILQEMGDDAFRIGGLPGLSELLQKDEVTDVQKLAELLRRKTKFRALIKLAARLGQRAMAEDDDPEKLSEELVRELFELGQGIERRRGLVSVDEIANTVISEGREKVQALLQGETVPPKIRTGIGTVDDFYLPGGFEPGQLILLAARPGIGKSTLAGNIALDAVRARPEDPVAVFNLEMRAMEVWKRFVIAASGMTVNTFLQNPSHHGYNTLEALHRQELGGRPLYVCDEARVTVPYIHAELARIIAMSGRRPSLVVVDYLQLLSSPDNSRAAKQNEAVRIGEISRGLKLAAREFGVPFLVLSQLNREVENRQGGIPQLSDLRDSGSLEQDADIVMFLHRKAKPAAHGEEEDRTGELVLAKHRNGPTGRAGIYFDGPLFRVRGLERHTDERRV